MDILPLFPLKLVLFPTEKLKLHVFEPRYKQLIGECLEGDKTFGIPPYTESGVAEFGTETRVVRVFEQYESGESDILVEGVRTFRLHNFYKTAPDKLYPAGDVEFLENMPMDPPAADERLAQAFARFHELLKTGYKRDRFDVPNLSYQLGQEVGLPIEMKIGLLGIQSESDRQRLILEHLTRAIPLLEAGNETRKRVRGNGHFKKLPPLDL